MADPARSWFARREAARPCRLHVQAVARAALSDGELRPEGLKPSPAMEVVLPIVGVVIAIGGALFKLARDVRVHDRSIFHADQDLASWVEDDNHEFTSLRIKVHNEQKRDELGRGEAHSLLQRTRRELRTRYRNELRKAERVVQQIHDVEHWPHRLYRRLARKPVPELTAPKTKSHVLETWQSKQPYQDWADSPFQQ